MNWKLTIETTTDVYEMVLYATDYAEVKNMLIEAAKDGYFCAEYDSQFIYLNWNIITKAIITEEV